ncbi:fructose-1,6-bisphosphatase [Ignavigranum ruoffiae]|uniref:fructose-1,6-bisphosphatase n=1 Tax=Ignavigranum ruoffiae TaxID=89093 RepID=UPI0023526C78|nr:fructose-1,6-bisphosphatase [Ignavigranum ruoffiae]
MNTLESLTELINLEAIQQLPKATEHFISDLHGEFETFDHILRNCSGIISIKVAELFRGELSTASQKELCYIIYYPEEVLKEKNYNDEDWMILLNQLVRVTRYVSSKYTRSKVRKAMPKEYAYILEELLYQYDESGNKQEYFDSIFSMIIDLNLAYDFAVVLSYLIQRFVVDHLHILGDIYDRGPRPDLIIEALMKAPSLDIQWGNHDLIWMGAMARNFACLAIVLRITLRYGHTRLLEDVYGINLNRLRKFSEKYYQDNDEFRPRGAEKDNYTVEEQIAISKMHQAIAIIQFKLEGQIIHRRPEFKQSNRLLLEKLSEDRKTITINQRTYDIINGAFDLVDYENPYELTLDEELIIVDLMNQFQNSESLKKHIDFLVDQGSMYTIYNGNLLFHGCIPCNEDGSLKEISFNGESYSGKALMDFYQEAIYQAMADPQSHEDFATDLMWYLWCGEGSSLFGKHTMKTFERYYIAEKETHKEIQNVYYFYRNDEKFCLRLMDLFGSSKSGYIINGHTPVKAKSGEDPIKANGRMLVIDGGLAKAYNKVTGIAGYTLVDNSHEVYLAAHHPFKNKKHAIENRITILPEQKMVLKRSERLQVKDTDIGKMLQDQSVQIFENLKHRQDLENKQ